MNIIKEKLSMVVALVLSGIITGMAYQSGYQTGEIMEGYNPLTPIGLSVGAYFGIITGLFLWKEKKLSRIFLWTAISAVTWVVAYFIAFFGILLIGTKTPIGFIPAGGIGALVLALSLRYLFKTPVNVKLVGVLGAITGYIAFYISDIPAPLNAATYVFILWQVCVGLALKAHTENKK